MTFKHLTENPREQARAWNIPLGVPGFRYADLNRVRRLEALDRAVSESQAREVRLREEHKETLLRIQKLLADANAALARKEEIIKCQDEVIRQLHQGRAAHDNEVAMPQCWDES